MLKLSQACCGWVDGACPLQGLMPQTMCFRREHFGEAPRLIFVFCATYPSGASAFTKMEPSSSGSISFRAMMRDLNKASLNCSVQEDKEHLLNLALMSLNP